MGFKINPIKFLKMKMLMCDKSFEVGLGWGAFLELELKLLEPKQI
jgi:hypothetical protein